MKFHQIQTAIAILLAILFSASSAVAEEQSADLKSIVEGNTAFALDLYSVLKKEEGNLFLSPYSISAALAMTYGGARGNTAKEMEKALHFTPGKRRTHPAFAELDATLGEVEKKGKVQLQIANSLWYKKGSPFLPEYLTLVKQYYGASVPPIDFAKKDAYKIINRWVKNETKERIKNLLPGELPPLTQLVLVNAIYFKGDWASQFDSNLTNESNFTLLNGKKKQVPMMYQKGTFGYRDLNDLQVLELPYIGKRLSMFIILPRDETGLQKIENNFTESNLRSWISNLQMADVRVYLPKFKIIWGTFVLNDSLKTLGMQDAFSGRADFSGMLKNGGIWIEGVYHKAFIEVNEDGTEAAAATAVILKALGYGDTLPSPIFRADHPFLFMIRENTTGSILFLGRVVDPSIQGG